MNFLTSNKSPYLHEYYNCLLDVESADAQLKGRALFVNYLSSFSALVSKFGLSSAIGTRLLHRHYEISPSTAVIERCSEVAGERVLQSSVDTTTDTASSAFVWAWNDGLMPLEFSQDPAVARMLAVDKQFVFKWGELVNDCGLADLLGLSYICRDYLQPRAGEILVETSDAEASTVRIGRMTDCEEGDITTVWLFEPLAFCRPGNYCRKWSTCRRSGFPPDDRHFVSYGHDALKGPHT